ncbi:cellulose binding domain-containing protein [Plantactinospora sp. CA-290183]|uniref:cellulose binding domain-containing protein n=1 Tax=Plantactinospora sp. CA-290183 TaxID=3240006 RepID=UPI003D941C3D
MRKHNSLRVRGGAVVAGGLLGATALVGLLASPVAAGAAPDRVGAVAADVTAAAPSACRVSYAVKDQWSSGFIGEVTVHNDGPQVNNWKLTWSFSGAQQLNGVWNGLFQQDGAAVTVTGDGHNFNILEGGSVTFGLNVSGPPAVPTQFALNGVVCG